MSEKFEQFAIVELFGHMVIVGKVTEEAISGQGFIRVDVPETEKSKAFTKFYGPGAIYAITPCDEATMLAAANGLKTIPVDPWSLNLPAFPRIFEDSSDNDDE